MEKKQKDQELKFWEKGILKILQYGKIPNHIAFIMDGNRRYAQRKGQDKTQGHYYGLESLKKCLQYCLELGVKEVSIFAFALDNFKREQREIDVLMDLAQKNLRQMAENGEFLQKHQIQVKICGKISSIPSQVAQAMQEIMELTESNNKLKLNICFAYSSTYELENAIENIVSLSLNHSFNPETLNTESFKQFLLIPNNPEIIVRSGNEIRLSDFMTFQAENAQLQFLKESWPEINLISMLKIIINYQLSQKNCKQDNKIN